MCNAMPEVTATCWGVPGARWVVGGTESQVGVVAQWWVVPEASEGPT